MCQCAGTASVKNSLISLCGIGQVGLWKEAWQHQRGEREGATAAQVQEGVQGRSEGDQEGLTLPGQREAQRGHEQVGDDNIQYQTKTRREERFLGKASNVVLVVYFRDAERKRKVRELFGSLATQEGEWKALKKRKRK